jgi:hypothetical protein
MSSSILDRLRSSECNLLHSSIKNSNKSIREEETSDLLECAGQTETFLHRAFDWLQQFGAIHAAPIVHSGRLIAISNRTLAPNVHRVIQPPFQSIEQLQYAVRLIKFQSFADKQECLTYIQATSGLLPLAVSKSLQLKPSMDRLYEQTRAGVMVGAHLQTLMDVTANTPRFRTFDQLVVAVTKEQTDLLHSLTVQRQRLARILQGLTPEPEEPNPYAYEAPRLGPVLLKLPEKHELSDQELIPIQNALNVSGGALQSGKSASEFAKQLLFRVRTLVPFFVECMIAAKSPTFTSTAALVDALQEAHKQYQFGFTSVSSQLLHCNLLSPLAQASTPRTLPTTAAQLDAIHAVFVLEWRHSQTTRVRTSSSRSEQGTLDLALASPLHLSSYLSTLHAQGRRFTSISEMQPELERFYEQAMKLHQEESKVLRRFLLSKRCNLLTTDAKRALRSDPSGHSTSLEKLVAIGLEYKLTALYLVKLLSKNRANAAVAAETEVEPLATNITDLLDPIKALSTSLQGRNLELLRFIQSPAHIHLLLSTNYSKHLTDGSMFHLREIEDRHDLDIIETLSAIDEQRKENHAAAESEEPLEIMFPNLQELEEYLDLLIAQEYGEMNEAEEADAEEEEDDELLDLPELNLLHLENRTEDGVISSEHLDDRANGDLEGAASPYDDPDPAAISPSMFPPARSTTPKNKGKHGRGGLGSAASTTDLLVGEDVNFMNVLSSPTQRVAQEIRAKVEQQARRLQSRRGNSISSAPSGSMGGGMNHSPSMRVLLTSQAAAPTDERSLSPISAARFTALPHKLHCRSRSDGGDGYFRDHRGMEEQEYRESTERIIQAHARESKLAHERRNKIFVARSRKQSIVPSSATVDQQSKQLTWTTQLPMFFPLVSYTPATLWLSPDKPKRYFNLTGLSAEETEQHLLLKISIPDTNEGILRAVFSLQQPVPIHTAIQQVVASAHKTASESTNGSSRSQEDVNPFSPFTHTVYEYLRPGLPLRVGIEARSSMVTSSPAFLALFPNGSNELEVHLEVEIVLLTPEEAARSLLPPSKSKAKPTRGPQRDSIASAEAYWTRAGCGRSRMSQVMPVELTYDRSAVPSDLLAEMHAMNGQPVRKPIRTPSIDLSHAAQPPAAANTTTPRGGLKISRKVSVAPSTNTTPASSRALGASRAKSLLQRAPSSSPATSNASPGRSARKTAPIGMLKKVREVNSTSDASPRKVALVQSPEKAADVRAEDLGAYLKNDEQEQKQK